MNDSGAQRCAKISKTWLCLLFACVMALAFSPNSAFAANTTTANTPTEKTSAAWTFDYKTYSGVDYPNASEPIVNGDYVYVAVNNKLVMLNKSDGKVAKEAGLLKNVGYTTRPVIVNNVIVVPENDGFLQAFKLGTLDTVWTLADAKADAQCCSTLTVDGNNVIFATANVDFTAGTYTDGYLTCVDTSTGARVWQKVDTSDGYYWDGGAIKGSNFVISTCNGALKVFDKATGKQLDSESLGGTMNSDVVFSEDGNTGYALTRDGKLHTFTVSDGGRIGDLSIKDLGLSGCACTPTISGGKMYVGGEIEGGSALAIVDLSTFETQLVKTADGTALGSGGIKGAPLVSTHKDATYVYFTVNNATTEDWVTYTAGGGVYMLKVGDVDATTIYDAAGHHQYCDSPVTSDADGNLYYINDSGTVFKVKTNFVGSASMNRLYNKYTGEHFYTSDSNEKSTLVKLGWIDEGVGWKAPATSKTPVYRLYNKYTSDHHYTTSEAEKKACVKAGWTDEGIGWYSDDAQGVKVFRQFNPYATIGTHNYTTSETERDTIVPLGWQDEGIAWYGVK